MSVRLVMRVNAGIAMRAYELAKQQGRGVTVDIPSPGAV